MSCPSIFRKPTTKYLIGVLLFCFCLVAEAQNTKGDKPAPPISTQPKLKKGKPIGNKPSRVSSKRARNVFPQNGPFVNNPSKKPKKERPSTVRLPGAPSPNPPSGKDKAWRKGDIAGHRIKSTTSKTGRIPNVYPQRSPYSHPSYKAKREKPSTVRLPSASMVRRGPSGKEKPWVRGPVSGNKFPSQHAKTRPKNVFPASGPFVSNPSKTPKPAGSVTHNKPLHAGRRLSVSKAVRQGNSMGIRGAGFKTITSQFITRGKKDVYWGKFRKKEKAITTDIAGRKLRTRNYHSPRPGLVSRDTLPFFRRTPKAARRAPPSFGGYKSATRTGRPWAGDVSGSKVRRIKPSKNKEVAGEFVWPRKLSVTGKIKRAEEQRKTPPASKPGKPYLSPLPGKAPGAGARAFTKFTRSAGPKKRIQGAGGSISGKSWNNNNQPVQGKTPGLGAKGYYTYGKRFDAQKRIKGYGGSASGKSWNNRNRPIQGKGLSPNSYFAAHFSGTAKTKRAPKGGGSVSGQSWNNKGQPVDVNTAGSGTVRASKFRGKTKGIAGGVAYSKLGLNYTGDYKSRRPAKGGGSVSGKHWNNDGQPVDVNEAGRGTVRASKFQGLVKAKRPAKGGGSISGKHWNNNGEPVDVNEAGKGTVRASKYSGTLKYQKAPETAGKPATFQGKIPGFAIGAPVTKLGLNYEGDYKRKNQGIDNRQVGLLAKIFKTEKTLPATHARRDERVATYSIRGRRSIFDRYVQHPKADDESLKKDRDPDGIRLNLPIVNQTKRSVNAGHYNHAMKQYWNYTRNPNSDKESLKVREPGKANARIGDLQVNVKMKKYSKPELHPDAKFAHSYRDNVKEEKTIFMNLKLTWSKLFKKSENQPRGLKQKHTRPRYDPNEKGLWYD